MTREKFLELVEDTMASLTVECIQLYDKGVPAEHCLELAIEIHDAKALGRAQQRAAILPAPGPFARQ